MNLLLLLALGGCLLFAALALVSARTMKRPGRPPAPETPLAYHYDEPRKKP